MVPRKNEKRLNSGHKNSASTTSGAGDTGRARITIQEKGGKIWVANAWCEPNPEKQQNKNKKKVYPEKGVDLFRWS